MSHPSTASGFLTRHLQNSSEGIAVIAKLVREDQMRRDTDDETPFLSPGDVDRLMSSIQQLSDRVCTLASELEEVDASRRQPPRRAEGGMP